MPSNKESLVEVIAVAFERFGELRVFVQSWLNQTEKNWRLTVIHDGPNDEFVSIMNQYKERSPTQIYFHQTISRFNDYGHSLRDIGLNIAEGDYVLLTNADNYFIPKAIEFLNVEITKHQPDVVIYNMIHSHDQNWGPAYSLLDTKYAPSHIDVSAAIVKTGLAKAVGFRDKSFNGDATYFVDIANHKAPAMLNVVKIKRVLFVHN